MAVANGYFRTPPVLKNLLIINFIVYLAGVMIPGAQSWMIDNMALHFWKGGNFEPYQLITYMFLHGNMTHIFSNMFVLWMFGRILEQLLGSQRFLVYYIVCGIGAGLIQLGVNWIDYSSLTIASSVSDVYRYSNAVTLGASGAVFGILLGVGMLRPNDRVVLLFPPIPMKMKWLVVMYAVLELMAGVGGAQSGVAHFAHLGGMLWGFLLLWYWKKTGKLYY